MVSDNTQLIQFIQASLPISYEKAADIARRFTPKTILKNELILKEGSVCNEYYFLASGFVRAYTYDLKGNDITTSFYADNQVACDLSSFFKRHPTKETFEALADCQAWYITFDNLQVVFHSMPEFREFGRLMLVNAYAELKQRMLALLHYTAEERYSQLIQNKPKIFQYAPLKHIASYLGITSTSLSRIRKELSRK